MVVTMLYLCCNYVVTTFIMIPFPVLSFYMLSLKTNLSALLASYAPHYYFLLMINPSNRNALWIPSHVAPCNPWRRLCGVLLCDGVLLPCPPKNTKSSPNHHRLLSLTLTVSILLPPSFYIYLPHVGGWFVIYLSDLLASPLANVWPRPPPDFPDPSPPTFWA